MIAMFKSPTTSNNPLRAAGSVGPRDGFPEPKMPGNNYDASRVFRMNVYAEKIRRRAMAASAAA